MSEEMLGGSEPFEAEEELWKPSPFLQNLLWYGVLASLAAGGLWVGGLLLDLLQGDRQGFTLSWGLSLATIAPEILVLTTFYWVAEEIKDQRLQTSAACVFGFFWIFQIFTLSAEDFIPRWASIALVVLGVLGLLCVIGFAHERYPKQMDKIGGVPVFLAVSAYIVFENVLGLDIGLLGIVILFLLLGMIALPIWFSLSLIWARPQLGQMSSLLGWAQVFGYAVMVTALVSFGIALSREMGPNMKPDEWDKLIVSLSPILIRPAVVVVAVQYSLTAALFASLRNRGEEVFDPITENTG